MLITISNVLDADHLTLLRGMIPALTWKDGAETAGHVAKQVKQNQQADLESITGQKIEQVLRDAVTSNSVLKAAAILQCFSTLLLSKTETGGGYGLHIDNPFMRAGERTLRTDLSFTLFLSAPQDYEGGELLIEHAGQNHELKAEAGDLVLYPSTSLHKVAAVTSGVRLTCIGWIESRVKDAADRETLFDLSNLKAELQPRLEAQSVEMLILSKVIANLKRRFG